ncbi:MAG: ABC transporter permease [Firmicutes bacterium]|nr:ABC transporter permease [Bacillota bacterium]
MLALKRIRTKPFWREIALIGLAISSALIIGGVFVVISGHDPLRAYLALIRGAFWGWYNFGETLVYTTPLILTGLSIALAYRCGLFNIGAEGQLIVAMVTSAWIGTWSGIPAGLHALLTLLGGMVAGGLWGAIPGLLKAKTGAHEVINTIMLNYLALYLSHYLVTKPLIAPPGMAPVTRTIARGAMLPQFLPPSRANLGLLIALLACLGVYLLLWRTTWGYEIRAVGLNQEAARYGGIKVARIIVMTMAISGGLAGLAGAVVIQGVQHKFFDLFAFPGYGFDGIAVALLGRNHPFGVIFGALLFGALSNGALQMQSAAGVPKEIIGVVQGTIILFVATEEAFRWFLRSRRRKHSVLKEGEKVGVSV